MPRKPRPEKRTQGYGRKVKWRTRKRLRRAYKTRHKTRKPVKKNQILGLPSWLVIGGAALGIFLLTRKASATAPSKAPGTNYLVQPTGGWAYPPMTPATFGSWCQANNGVPMGSDTCMISGKGAYKLVGSRLKLGDQWVLTDDDLF